MNLFGTLRPLILPKLDILLPGMKSLLISESEKKRKIHLKDKVKKEEKDDWPTAALALA